MALHRRAKMKNNGKNSHLSMGHRGDFGRHKKKTLPKTSNHNDMNMTSFISSRAFGDVHNKLK